MSARVARRADLAHPVAHRGIELARGMMRTQPLLLVLDEPTAAFDAHTEHDLFERYAPAARAGQHAGTVTLHVTHRKYQ